MSGIKTARRKLVIRGWEGTVKVAASVLGVELMMGVIVSGHEGEETVTTAEVEAEAEAEAAAENIDPDELLEDNRCSFSIVIIFISCCCFWGLGRHPSTRAQHVGFRVLQLAFDWKR